MSTAHQYYGCLFCFSGKEAEVIRQLARKTGIKAMSPVRQHYYRNRGQLEIIEDRAFPGYLFFAAESPDYPVTRFETIDGVLKVLRYDSEEWILQGDDAALAERLFKCNGVIGLSRARFENGRLHIIDGFMKPYEKDICKVDKRHQVAMVKTKMNNRYVELWLGYYLDETPAASSCLNDSEINKKETK